MRLTTKLKWANRVLRSKHFVVLTDKDSVIAIEGIKLDSLEDVVMLAEQQAAIEAFLESLKQLKRDHDARSQQLMEEQAYAQKKNTATKRANVKPIKIQEK